MNSLDVGGIRPIHTLGNCPGGELRNDTFSEYETVGRTAELKVSNLISLLDSFAFFHPNDTGRYLRHSHRNHAHQSNRMWRFDKDLRVCDRPDVRLEFTNKEVIP